MTDDDDNVVCLSWAVIMGEDFHGADLLMVHLWLKLNNMNNHQFERNSQLGK